LSGIVFVVRGGKATTAELGDAIRQLEFPNVKILGFVYNSAEGAKKNNYSKKYVK
jgi:Mrp family chromosome partitioning ATPase